MNKSLFLVLWSLWSFPFFLPAQEIRITSFDPKGSMTWSNTFWNTTCRVEFVSNLLPSASESWSPVTSVYATNAVTSAAFAPVAGSQGFYRVSYASSLFLGLAGCWSLDGNANDASRNTNHGTAYGATATTNRMAAANSAYYFDGSGTYIGVPNSSSLNMTNMTLAFWFRLDSSGAVRELVNKMGPEGTRTLAFGSEYASSDQKIRFRICTDGWLGTLTDCPSTSSIAPGTWYHFAGTYDGSAMRVYINGVFENSVPKSGAIFSSTEEVKIGRYGYYAGWVFHGAIDNVIIWNRALSSNEVAQVYSNENL